MQPTINIHWNHNKATFTASLNGCSIILLEANVEVKQDLPRFYRTAKDNLNEVLASLRLANAA